MMRKIKVTDAAGGYVFDETGKRYKCIGNVNYHAGDDAYCSGSVCLGNTRRGFKPMLAKTSGEGFSLWYARSDRAARVIEPRYYQKDGASPGSYVADLKVLTKNLQTQAAKGWDGQFFHYYLYPGLYNVGDVVNSEYADIKTASKDVRLLSVFNDVPILQNGLLKASTKYSKITLKSCEPYMKLEGLETTDVIAYEDAIFDLISFESHYLSDDVIFQNFLYSSLYKDDEGNDRFSDNSTKYEFDDINTLSLSSKNAEISFNIKDKIDAKMGECFSMLAEKDDAPVWPPLSARPLPQSKVLWYTVTDPDFNRIDDLAENAKCLQFSNIKLFNVTDTACTLSVHTVGVAYVYFKHETPAGDIANEWVPVVVNGYFTFYCTAEECKIVYFAYDSQFLKHTVYEKRFFLDAEIDISPISIGSSQNVTGRGLEYYDKDSAGNAGYIRTVNFGAINKGFNNACTDKAVQIDDGFMLKLTDSLEFNSKKGSICSTSSGKELIKVGKVCNAGINDFNKFKVLLVNEVAYLLKDDQLLKKADLSIKNLVLLNVALSYSKDVNKTLKEGL